MADPDLTKNDEIYLEVDDTNPNQLIYDLEKDEIIVPKSEDEVTTTTVKKVVSRNVSNTRRRRFR